MKQMIVMRRRRSINVLRVRRVEPIHTYFGLDLVKQAKEKRALSCGRESE